tara:strand:+ start:27822 stop:30008 length:2187 start_codon:yes stop_codon:yes gene_type:complete
MAVGSGTPYNIHIGNGVTRTFGYGFTLLDADDLVVTIDGVATSAYTITGLGVAAGGTVVFSTAPASGAKIILQRVIQLVRATDYQDDGDLLADTLNDDFNRLWMAVQGVSAGDARSIRAPFPEVLNDLPAAVDRADKILTFNSAGQPILTAPVAGTAGALATDLASTASATKGAGMVYLNVALSYPAGSLGAHAWNKVYVSSFPFLATGDGTTDDSAAFASAVAFVAANGGDLHLDRGKNYKITTGNIEGSHVARLIGDESRSSRITFTGSGTLFHNLGGAYGFSIYGNNKAGAQIGIKNEDWYRERISNCEFHLLGKGIQISGSGQTVEDNYFSYCGIGLHVYRQTSLAAATTTFTSRKNWFEGNNKGLWFDSAGLADGVLACQSVDDIFQLNTGYGLLIDKANFPFILINPYTEQNCTTPGWYAIACTDASYIIWDGGYQMAGDVNSFGTTSVVIRRTIDGISAKGRYRITNADGTKVFVDVQPDVNLTTLLAKTGTQRMLFSGGAYSETGTGRVEIQGGIGDVGFRYGNYWQSARTSTTSDGCVMSLGVITRGSVTDSYTDLLAIDDAGPVYPGFDNSQTLGKSGKRWSQLYAGTATINTSDEREKQDIGAIPDAWLDAWADVQWVRFKFKDAAVSKGADGARWHIGMVAQRVRDAFAARGIDALAIGLLCYDEWPGSPEVLDDEGTVTMPAAPAGNRWGIRYEEALAMEAALMRRELNRLKAQH